MKAYEEKRTENRMDRRQFTRALFALALPVAMQALISAAVGYADVWALSHVSQEALSAVSLAGQITFVLTLAYMGLSTGLSILATQYWGRGDVRTIGKTLGLSLRLSCAASVVFFLLTLCVPQALMRIFTPDAGIAAHGARYLRVAGFSYLAMAGSQMLLAAMKSVERTKESALISICCLTANMALNMLVVFVLCPGDAARCVTGVAAATTLSRAIETALCVAWLRRSPIAFHRGDLLRTERWLKRDFARCTVEVQLNYLVWGGAMTAMSAIVGHVSADMVSAYAVAGSVKSLVIVGCTGFATGGCILLGKQLGAGQLALAEQTGRRLRNGSLALGACAGLLLLLVRPLCMRVFALTPQAGEMLGAMLYVSAFYCIGQSFNSTMVSGVFCAGGDTRFGLIQDVVVMWGIILPLGCLSAFVLRLPPQTVFFVLCLDEWVKLPIVWLHDRKKGWLRNLTRDGARNA